MKRHLLLAFGLAGCQSLPPAEYAWQAVHAVDVAQTVQIARSPCFQESDAATAALIGEHPSTAGALAWGFGLAAIHAGVTVGLERIDAPRWVRASWQVLSVANTARFVKQNADQGIGPFGADC
jgi:hypothetical protein